MREIKFRLWMPREKRFVYWGFVDPNIGIFVGLPSSNDPQFTGIDYCREHSQQYTGLKDSHGKEIYEGDICEERQANHVWMYLVETHDGFGSNLFFTTIYRNFTINKETGTNEWGDFYTREGRDLGYNTKPYRVIGNIYENIYENPDLIKNDK